MGGIGFIFDQSLVFLLFVIGLLIELVGFLVSILNPCFLLGGHFFPVFNNDVSLVGVRLLVGFLRLRLGFLNGGLLVALLSLGGLNGLIFDLSGVGGNAGLEHLIRPVADVFRKGGVGVIRHSRIFRSGYGRRVFCRECDRLFLFNLFGFDVFLPRMIHQLFRGFVSLCLDLIRRILFLGLHVIGIGRAFQLDFGSGARLGIDTGIAGFNGAHKGSQLLFQPIAETAVILPVDFSFVFFIAGNGAFIFMRGGG